MLKQIDVVYGTESGEEALILPIIDAKVKDSLLLRKVTGLNPADITLFIGEYSRDGGNYQGRRVGTRNPVLTIDLNPNPALDETVSGLREMLYRIFLDPRVNADYTQLILREDDGRARYVAGYVEKFETDLFDVETTAQISMICPDPFVRDLIQTELSNPTGWLNVPFAYGGTAETGFEATVAVNAVTSVLTLSNNARTMVVTAAFQVGDVVYFNTNRGSRTITLTRAGVTTPLIAQLSTSSRWLELHSQSNVMTVYGDVVANRPAAITSLKYTAAYWGV